MAHRAVVAMVALWFAWGSSFPAMRVMVATMPPLLASGTVFLTVASTAALLVAAIPLWIVVLRALIGDRPGAGSSARLLLGFAGVAVVLLAGTGSPVRASGWGALVVAGSVLWAGGTMWASRSRSLPAPGPATAVELVAGGLAVPATAVVVGEPWHVDPGGVGAASWGAFAYLVLVDSLAGFAVFTWLLRSAPVSPVSTYAYAVPVVAYLVGVLVLGEPFAPAVPLGAVLVVTAVAAEVRWARPVAGCR